MTRHDTPKYGVARHGMPRYGMARGTLTWHCIARGHSAEKSSIIVSGEADALVSRDVGMNTQKKYIFWIFLVHGKKSLRWPQVGPGGLFLLIQTLPTFWAERI